MTLYLTTRAKFYVSPPPAPLGLWAPSLDQTKGKWQFTPPPSASVCWRKTEACLRVRALVCDVFASVSASKQIDARAIESPLKNKKRKIGHPVLVADFGGTPSTENGRTPPLEVCAALAQASPHPDPGEALPNVRATRRRGCRLLPGCNRRFQRRPE